MFSKRYEGRDTARKGCFGKSQYFKASDFTCQNCPDYSDCGRVVTGAATSPVSRSAMYSDRGYHGRPLGGVESSEVPAGVVREGETAFERFGYDVLTGMCRGGMWEGYSFFTVFRFGRKPPSTGGE